MFGGWRRAIAASLLAGCGLTACSPSRRPTSARVTTTTVSSTTALPASSPTTGVTSTPAGGPQSSPTTTATPAAPTECINPADNLLMNGDGEAAPPAEDEVARVAVPSWTLTGAATTFAYDASGPTRTESGVPDAGRAMFAGGPGQALSTFTQSVDIAPAATGEPFVAAACLGGFLGQADATTMSVAFLDAAGTPVGAPLPTVTATAADRHKSNSFVVRSILGTVPSGARHASVVLTMRRVEGAYNDGYADNVSLRLPSGGGRPAL